MVTITSGCWLLTAAQAQNSCSSSSTVGFNVKGTVTDPSGAVVPHANIVFMGEDKRAITVSTDELGTYHADLRFGLYTMAVHRSGLRCYRRPPFRITSPRTITFDVVLPLAQDVSRRVLSDSGRPIAPQEWNEAMKSPPEYYGEESFPAPPGDDSNLRVYVRYVRRKAADSEYVYTGDEATSDRVVVAYNLSSLEANHVAYDAKHWTVEGTGGVTITTGAGKTEHSDSIRVKIVNGRFATR